jgi:hypothetical protein
MMGLASAHAPSKGSLVPDMRGVLIDFERGEVGAEVERPGCAVEPALHRQGGLARYYVRIFWLGFRLQGTIKIPHPCGTHFG